MRSLLLALCLAQLTLLGGCVASVPRAGQPMFKGVELYSWQDPATRGWRFALLPGTNRRKAANEVRDSPGVVDSVGDLKARISRLAPAEQVFWEVPATGEFPLPPAAVVDDIIRSAGSDDVAIQVTGN